MKKKPEKLLKRTYRITKAQDKIVKRIAKEDKVSESQVIRSIINC